MAIAARPGYRRYFDVNGWLFVGPAVALIGVFMAYPIAKSLWLSFHSGQGAVMKFAGLGNIDRLLNDPIFFTALTNTFIFLFVQVPIMIVLALIMASCLNMPNLKFRGFLRTAVFLPCVTSLVAYSVLFKSMFSYDGLINSILLKLGIVAEPVRWLSNVWTARGLVGLMNFLMWFGNTTIILMAAIMGVDPGLYEAAQLDGASSTTMFWRITIPLIRPLLVYTLITSLIGGLQMFDVPQVLTNGKGDPNGSTNTIIMYLNQHLYSKNYGTAGAISVLMFLLCAVLCVIIYFTLTQEDDGLTREQRKAEKARIKAAKAAAKHH